MEQTLVPNPSPFQGEGRVQAFLKKPLNGPDVFEQ